MDKAEALAFARKTKAHNRQEKRDRDAFVQEVIEAVTSQLDVDRDNIEVIIPGTGEPVIYIWNPDHSHAKAYGFC